LEIDLGGKRKKKREPTANETAKRKEDERNRFKTEKTEVENGSNRKVVDG